MRRFPSAVTRTRAVVLAVTIAGAVVGGGALGAAALTAPGTPGTSHSKTGTVGSPGSSHSHTGAGTTGTGTTGTGSTGTGGSHRSGAGSTPKPTGTAPTTTTLTASPAAATIGQRVILSASVSASGGVPAGTVSFSDAGTSLGSRQLPAGQSSVSMSITNLPTGTHAITASYSGSSVFAGSQSAPVTVTIGITGGTPTQITFTASPQMQAAGQPVTLTANVDQTGTAVPTGEVQFMDGATAVSTHLLTNGAVTVSVTTLPSGPDTLTASYTGDSVYSPATSGTATVIINPTASQKFVAHLYTDLLGRPADTDGLLYWAGQIDKGMSNAQVGAALVNTDEYRSALISRLYQQVLNRPADGPGLQYWSSFLAQGGTPEQVAGAMVGSPEYYTSPQFGNNTVDTFIAAAYRSLLGRAPDPGGAGYWHNFLYTGGTPAELAAYFATSLEWSEITVTRYYMQIHFGTPDPGGLAYWSGQLQNGMTDAQLMAMLVGSGEYVTWTANN